MRGGLAWFQVFLYLSISFSDADKNVADQGSSMITEETVYEIVQKVLLSKFDSIDDYIKKKISVQNRQNSRRSDLRMLWRLNQRVSKLENEKQTMNEKSSKENENMENLERKAQNLSQTMQNLESRISIQENRSMITNVNKLENGGITNFSEHIGYLETILNDSTSKIKLLETTQQNLSELFENIESRMAVTHHETRRLITVPDVSLDEKITNVSVKMRNCETKIDDLESKLDDLLKTISFPHLQFTNDFSKRLQDVKLEFLNYFHAFQVTMETRFNDSVWMTQQLEKKVFKNHSASIQNILKQINNFVLEGSDFNTTVFSIEENMQIMGENITKINDKINRSKIEMSTLKRNLFETLDKALSRLNDSLTTETSDIKGQVKDFLQNMSEMHLKIENNSKKSLTEIQKEILLYKRDTEKTHAETIKKCEQAGKQVEESLDNTMTLFAVNLTKSMTLANNRIDLQQLKVNHSLVLITDELQSLKSYKYDLITNFSTAKKEFSENKINVTGRLDNLGYHILELESNMSSVAEEIQSKLALLTSIVTRNVSRIHVLIREISSSMSAMENKMQSNKLDLATIQRDASETYDQVKYIMKNVSLLHGYATLHSEFENSFNRSLKLIKQDFLDYKKESEDTRSEVFQKCVEMTKHLEMSIDEKVKISVEKLTENVELTSDRIDLQELKTNLSLMQIEKEIRSLGSDNTNLEANFADTKKELLNRIMNETIRADHIHVLITDIFSNISAINDEMQSNKLDLATIQRNASDTNDQVKYITKNVSLLNGYAILHLNFETDFNKSLKSIQKEVYINKRESMEQGADTVQRCLETTRHLKISVDDKMNLFFLNMTSTINNKIGRLSSIEYRIRTLTTSLNSVKTDLVRFSLNTGVVRLVNGGHQSGRVEIFHNGAWGTVCDDDWDNNDARVVCRMFGLREGGTAVVAAAFGQGTGNIWLDEVKCRGYESSIFACSHQRFGHNDCSHSEDAGVSCS